MQKPASVMVWAAISENWRSSLNFVKQGCKVNIKSYIEDILTPAFVKLNSKHFKNDQFIFQQDGAPSHTSKMTEEWCRSHFPRFWSKEMWPSSSPDLNLMDFSVWSILDKNAYSMPHKNVESLKKFLTREWANILQEFFCSAVKSFRRRLEGIIRVRGAHIKN